MAGTPHLKAYSPEQEYVAAFKFYEDAASFAAFRGDGTTIRWGHSKNETLWHEGAEEFSAGESFDRAAVIMRQRRGDQYLKSQEAFDARNRAARA